MRIARKQPGNAHRLQYGVPAPRFTQRAREKDDRKPDDELGGKEQEPNAAAAHHQDNQHCERRHDEAQAQDAHRT